MSAALQPDDAADDAAGCAHPSYHWHGWKLCRGTPHGEPGPDGYVAQGGYCHRCRLPVVRYRRLAPEWGPPEVISARPIGRGGPADSERRRDRRR